MTLYGHVVSVGLSMVCLQFMDNYEPTKADNYRKNVKTEDGVECQLDILDTAGMLYDTFQSFSKYYIPEITVSFP